MEAPNCCLEAGGSVSCTNSEIGTPCTAPSLSRSESSLEPTESECNVCFDILQNQQTLGTVRPITTGQTVSEFYDYASDVLSILSGTAYRYNNKNVPSLSDAILIFFHEDSNDCTLSLVIVADSPSDNTGGSLGMNVTADLSSAEVKDDPSSLFLFGDSYISSNGVTSIEWNWSDSSSDGLGNTFDFIPSVGEHINVTITSRTNIASWHAVTGTLPMEPTDPSVYIPLDLNQELNIQRVECK